jgi:hypothetical protein
MGGALYTQQDYQYVWFSDNSVGGTNIYTGGTLQDGLKLLNTSMNYGISGSTTTNSSLYITDIANNWSATSAYNQLATTIHPAVTNITDIIETGQAKLRVINGSSTNNSSIKIGVNIYFKYSLYDSGGTFNAGSIASTNTGWIEHSKKLKVFVETDNSIRPFEFELIFKLRNYRKSQRTNSSYTEPPIR